MNLKKVSNIQIDPDDGAISWTEHWIHHDGTQKKIYGKTYENGRGLAYWKNYEGYQQCCGICDFAINAKTKSGIAKAIKRMYH